MSLLRKHLSMPIVALLLFFASCKKQDLAPDENRQPGEVHMMGALPDKPEAVEKIRLMASRSYYQYSYKELMMKGKPSSPRGGGNQTDTSVTIITDPATLPSSVLLTMPPVLNQGSEGSCVAFASVYARSGEWYNKTGAASYSYTSNIFSPEFIYNQIKVSDCYQGSSIVDAINLLQNKGVCTWGSMPYSYVNGCSLMPTQSQIKEAAGYKISSSSRVVNSDQAAIKALLAQKKPLIISVAVDNSFYYAGPGFIWNSFVGSYLGGHALALSGYDDSKHAFRVINSWGTGWGDAGYAWIDYDFFPQVTGYTVYVLNN